MKIIGRAPIQVGSGGVKLDNIKLQKISANAIGYYFLKKFVRIYPNPTRDFLQVYYCCDNADIKLYNVFGQELLFVNKSPPSFQLDLSSFSKGIYYLQINTKQKSITQKIILTN